MAETEAKEVALRDCRRQAAAAANVAEVIHHRQERQQAAASAQGTDAQRESRLQAEAETGVAAQNGICGDCLTKPSLISDFELRVLVKLDRI